MNQVDLLRETMLFSGCPEQDLNSLREIAQQRDFGDGEMLFSRGDEARVLMVAASGTIQLELPVSILGDSKNIPFETKKRGEVVGWSAFVPPYRFTLSARACGRVSVVAFAQAELTTLFDSEPALGLRVLKNLTSIVGERLHHTQAMWAREVQRSLDERYR